MKSTTIRLSLLAVLMVFFSFSGKAQTKQNMKQTTLAKIGQQAPDFDFIAPNGKKQSLSDLKGKVVLINFFATWCGPCLKELPHLQKDVFEKYQNNEKFELLVIGREHKPEELAKFKQQKGFKLDFTADAGRSIYSKYATQFIPRNFLIDADGKVIYSSIGFKDEDFKKLKQLIADQLAK
ncbi:peroxiredoxin [Sunxiuqinia elliptica]|nr:peroxiredoxin [Sunxiuqinia elliptica]